MVCFTAPEVRRSRALIVRDEESDDEADGEKVPLNTVQTHPTSPPLPDAAVDPSVPTKNTLDSDTDFLSSNMSSHAAVGPASHLGSNMMSNYQNGSYGNGYTANNPNSLQDLYTDRSFNTPYNLAPQADSLVMDLGPMFDTWTPPQAWNQLGM